MDRIDYALRPDAAPLWVGKVRDILAQDVDRITAERDEARQALSAAQEREGAARLDEHGRTCRMASPVQRGDGVPYRQEDGDEWYCYCPRGKELAALRGETT